MEKLINRLKDKKTVLICPAVFKNRVLEYLSDHKEIIDVKFIDINEYRKNRLFNYDLKTIRYLTDKHGLSVSNARAVINNLYYVEDKKYGVEKLDNLVRIKKELEQNGLLIFNSLFDRFLEGRQIFAVGYGELSRFDRSIIDGEVIPYEEIRKKYLINVYENIEEEIEYVYSCISDLIRKGTDINNIYVLNASSDYEGYFKRYNTYYGFMVDYGSDEKLFGTSLAREFIEMLETTDKQQIYDRLAEEDNDVADKFINIINRYTDFDLKDVKNFVIEDLKNTNASFEVLTDVVRCTDMYTPFDKDDHVFLIGFNDQIPAFKSDIEYINNNLRPSLNMSTVEEENEIIRKNTRGYLSGIENLHISYCEKSPFKKYNQNNLFTKDECEYVEGQKFRYDHSDKLNKAKYAYMQDRLQKYGRTDEDYSLLQKYYGNNNYNTYSNLFKGLNKEQTDQLKDVKLSYTKMNDFYLCRFRYYLNYVLKITDNSGNFNTRIGSICHEVLKDLYTQKDFDFESSWARAYENEEARLLDGEKLFEDEAEQFFVQKIKEELKEDLVIINKQKDMTLLDKEMCEEYFKVKVDDNIAFDGMIDKVMYREGKDEIIANVVDYKTGSSSDIDKKIMEFGLSMQLPSYMYLLSKKDLFKGKKLSYGGFYLQHLVNPNRKYNEDLTLSDLKVDSMKFDGFTTDDLDRLQITDPELSDGEISKLYRTLRKKNDGTLYGTSNTMSDEEIEEKIELVEEKIKDAGKEIMKGNFVIDPKKINNRNVSCDYCPYLDICYRRVVYELKTKESRDDG